MPSEVCQKSLKLYHAKFRCAVFFNSLKFGVRANYMQSDSYGLVAYNVKLAFPAFIKLFIFKTLVTWSL